MKLKSSPSIYAVVPVHNRREWTLRFLDWFSRQTYPNVTTVIVDDGSTDGTAEAIHASYPSVRILHGNGHLWWAGATNLGVELALREGADYVLTINDDSIGSEGYLTELILVAGEDPRRIVGSRIMRADDPGMVWSLGTEVGGTFRFCFRLRNTDRRWAEIGPTLPSSVLPVTAMCGNGVLIPSEAFRETGRYEARWMPQYHADTDFILRAGARGYRPCIATKAVLLNPVNPSLGASAWQALFSPKSPHYIPAVWLCLWRYGCRWKAPFALLYICMEGTIPEKWKRRVRRGGR